MAAEAGGALILSVGGGERLRSELPGALHRVGGRPVVAWVVAAAREAGCAPIYLVVGRGAREIRDVLEEEGPVEDALRGGDVLCMEQGRRGGAGHALATARKALPAGRAVLVVSGDAPLVRPSTLRKLQDSAREAWGSVAVADLDVASDPGDSDERDRVIERDGRLERIWTEGDLTPAADGGESHRPGAVPVVETADADEREAGERDADEREAGERDADEREAGERDAAERDADERDAGERDAGEREVAIRTVNAGHYALPVSTIFEWLEKLAVEKGREGRAAGRGASRQASDASSPLAKGGKGGTGDRGRPGARPGGGARGGAVAVGHSGGGRRGYAAGTVRLADAVSEAAKGHRIACVRVEDASEAIAVDSRAQLAAAQRVFYRRSVAALLETGVTILDPESVWVDADVTVGPDSVLHPGVTLLGATSLGRGCTVHSGAWLRDSVLADGVEVLPYSVLDGARVGSGCSVGPFARLRPEAVLEEDVRVGNFVEVKKSTLGPGVKASHLSYLGDSSVGAGANIGAGVITCNYDGKTKSRTVIGEGAFVGSDTILVAPVEVGAGGYTGAGSVITKDVPEQTLAVGRARQKNIKRRPR